MQRIIGDFPEKYCMFYEATMDRYRFRNENGELVYVSGEKVRKIRKTMDTLLEDTYGIRFI